MARHLFPELSPVYDLAPMVLDKEAIARTTVWPQHYQHSVYEPNYHKIIRDFAEDPDITRERFIAELEKLADLRKKVVDLGAPGRVLEKKAVKPLGYQLSLVPAEDL